MLCSSLHSRLLPQTHVREGWGKPTVATWTQCTGCEGQCTGEEEQAFCVRWSLNHGGGGSLHGTAGVLRGKKTAGARRNIPLPSHWPTPRDAHLPGYSYFWLFNSLAISAIYSVNEKAEKKGIASWNILKTWSCLLAHQKGRKSLCKDEAGPATPLSGPDSLWRSLDTYLFWALHKTLTNRLLW